MPQSNIKKMNKNITIALISILISNIVCYAAPLCPNACALRVPVNNDYDHLGEVMLSTLSISELIEKIYPDYERYIILLEGFCKCLEEHREISKTGIQEYLGLKKKLSIILNLWNSKTIDLWHSSKEREAGFTEKYWKRVMQIDNNGLFSVPAVDAYIARTIKADELNTSVQSSLASNSGLFLEGKKILMIQDRPATVFLNKDYCVERGANEKDIIVAGDYETAISALDSNKFDAIILDMGFPIKEGRIEEAWAGLNVLEYIATNNMIVPVLIDSSRVGQNLSIIHERISENSEKYPNLAKLGKKTDIFLGIFPSRLGWNNPNDDRFIELLRIDLEGARASL